MSKQIKIMAKYTPLVLLMCSLSFTIRAEAPEAAVPENATRDVEQMQPSSIIEQTHIGLAEVPTPQAAGAPSEPASENTSEPEPVPFVDDTFDIPGEEANPAAPQPALQAATSTADVQQTVSFNTQSEEQKRAYASGAAIADYIKTSMKQQQALKITLDPKIVLAGITDSFNNNLRLERADIQEILASFDQQVEILTAAQAQKERAAGDAYRADFAKTPNVKTAKNGMLYLIEEKGTGEIIRNKDLVVVDIKSMLPDGTVLGTEDAQTETTTRVEDAKPVVAEGIKLLRKGGKVRLVVPPNLGYGEQGLAPHIPANATLVFDIHVIDVKS